MPTIFLHLPTEVMFASVREQLFRFMADVREFAGSLRQQLWFLAAAGLMLFLTGSVQADTSVSGAINASTRWTLAASPYRVTGDVVIQNGATLSIDPGVVIYMAVNTNLIVQSGGLQALGTVVEPIQVLSERTRLGQTAAAGDWNQWVFNSGASNVRLEHLLIEHGRGLAINESSPQFNYLTLRNHAGPAISMDLGSSPSGVGLSASGCTLNGILVPAGEIRNNVQWGLRGIPYVVAAGTVSVGAAPSVTSVTPASVEQGQTVMLSVAGSRLGGLSSAVMDQSGLNLTSFGGGSASLLYFLVDVAANAPLGTSKLTLQVDAGEVVVPGAVRVTPPLPAITALSPNTVEAHGAAASLTLTGRNFSSQSQVLVNSAAIPTQFHSATELLATLPTQSAAAVLPVQVRNPSAEQGGEDYLSNALNLSVLLPTPPSVTVEPTPLALPPDSLPHEIVVRLSKADYKDNVLTLAVSDSNKATVSPTSVTLPAGQTSTRIVITPKSVGTVSLTVSAPGLTTVSIPVFVTTDFAGVSTSYAAPVGVLVGSATPEPVSVQTQVTHANVGVAVGAVLTRISPKGVPVGASRTFTLQGYGIAADAQLAMVPDVGVALSNINVAADGQSLQFTLIAAADAQPGPRRIVVRNGTGALYTFTDPAESFVTLVAGAPEIDSIAPIQATPGTRVKLLIRGRNLQAGQVGIAPAEGLSIDTQPVIDTAGTSLELDVQIAPDAAIGARRIKVTTVGGASADTLVAGNTLNIVSQIKETYTPLLAPLVGVQVGDASTTPTEIQVPLLNSDVGVLLGAGLRSMAPQVGTIGTTQTVTIAGQGLDSVATIALVPAAGAQLGVSSVNPEGTELTFTISLDADAALGPRRVVLSTASGYPLTFVDAAGGLFLVTAPVAEITSTTPPLMLAGTTSTITLSGRNFINVQSVRLIPADGTTINGPFVTNGDGTSLSFSVIAAANAPSSPRTLIVNSAGGDSSPVAQAGNTLRIAQQTGPTYSAIAAPLVGIQVGDNIGLPPQPYDGTLGSAVVGVVVGTPVEETISTHAVAAPLGVVVGPAVTGMTPAGWLRGASGTVSVTGVGLQAVTTAAFSPATGMLLGIPVANGEGSQLSIPLSVAPDAQQVARKLVLTTVSGELIWLAPEQALVNIGSLPSMTSVAPIVWSRGGTLALTIRGSNLQGVTGIALAPAGGVSFSGAPIWSQDGLGELLSVTLYVAPDAVLGDRSIVLEVPGGATSAVPDVSNRVRIVAPN